MREKTKKGLAVFCVGILAGAALWLGISCIPSAHTAIYEGIGIDKVTEQEQEPDKENTGGTVDIGDNGTIDIGNNGSMIV